MAGVVDLQALLEGAQGSGPQWGTESEQLDATLLTWQAGEGVQEHVNQEVDVLVVALRGSATVTIDDESAVLSAGQIALIPKGTRRSILAREPFAHLNVHPLRKRLDPLGGSSFRGRQLPGV